MALFGGSKDLEDSPEDIARRERAEKIIVTTCDINKPYEILGPVYNQVANRGVFSSAFDKLEKKYSQFINTMEEIGLLPKLKLINSWESQFDRAFYIAVEELKLRAERLGADAVIGMRQDIDIDNDGSAHFYIQVYGTAVKFSS